MQDVFLGSLSGTPDIAEGDVLSVYHYKTGRYTFTLPLQLGAVLAEVQDTGIMAGLSRLGELLGIIFQIKDDEIGLFGETGNIGKPVGSDVAEGKKTIFYVRLMQRVSEEEKSRLGQVFGVEGQGESGLAVMRELLARHRIRSEVDRQVQRLAEEARGVLDDLPTKNAQGRDLLVELLEYNLERSR
jgi:geranylgeranyl diphosphate synthase type I